MNPLEAVSRFLEEHDIRNIPVTAALSGGADSVCLLLCLWTLRDAFELKVAAVHIQHALRGEESVRDEHFCRDVCQTLGVPLQVVPVEVEARRAKSGSSVETAARELRYEVFSKIPGYVATAHTADDQLETLLMRLARGTGLPGLCGIPEQRDNCLRPLLSVTREEVEAFLAARAQPFVTDSSNLTDDFARNVLRHHAVPAMRAVNAQAARHAAQTVHLLREEEDFLSQAAAETYASRRQPDGSVIGLEKVHPAMARRCLRIFLEENGFAATREQVLTAQSLLAKGGSVELTRGMPRVCVSHGTLFLRAKEDVPSRPLLPGRNVLYPGCYVDAAVLPREEPFASVYKKFIDCALDYDIIEECAVLHGRRQGMRFLPAGRKHHVVIKKWLQARVSPTRRNQVHYLSDAQGLLWVEGIGTAARAAITARTKRILLLWAVHTADARPQERAGNTTL